MRTNKTMQWLYALGQSALVAILMALVAVPMLSPSTARAEGSKELTQDVENDVGDVVSYRPWLENQKGVYIGGIERDTTINVYAKVGETIQLASSVSGDNKILLYAPGNASGTATESFNTGTGTDECGFIKDRGQEVDGPDDGYTPCEIIVAEGEEGIWQIQFKASGGGNPAGVLTENDWNTTGYHSIAAWDVTVLDSSSNEVKGRAYTNKLPVNAASVDNPIYSKLYILTKDGVLYDFDTNGLQPYGAILFANSSGFKKGLEPIYRSIQFLNGNTAQDMPAGYSLHSPDAPDTETDVTHKMFFNPPDTAMPSTSRLRGVETWLNPPYTPPGKPTESSFDFNGNTTEPGGTFSFDNPNTSASGYQIIINVDGNSIYGDNEDRTLTGRATLGANGIVWDGRDADGELVAANTYNVQLTLFNGEVHFPVLDAEMNKNGTIIHRLNRSTGSQEGATVYYDDSYNYTGDAYDFSLCAAVDEPKPPAVNSLTCYGDPPNPRYDLDGRDSSDILGVHKWGNAGGDDFGNIRGIDIWTYYLSSDTLVIDVTVNGDYAPTIVRNSSVPVSDGGTATITADHLKSTDVEDDANTLTLTYILDALPLNGVLKKNGTDLVVNGTFTQDDIDSGRITYNHTSGKPTLDKFPFTVTDSDGNTTDGVFKIANTPPIVDKAVGITINQGTKDTTIDDPLLAASDKEEDPDSTLTYTLLEVPTKGTLYIDDGTTKTDLVEGATFTQNDIDQGYIKYDHTDTTTTEDDQFVIQVQDSVGAKSDTIPFLITINDPPEVVVNTGVEIDKGDNPTITIEMLRSTDKEDVNPTDLVYTLEELPTEGVLKKDGVELNLTDNKTFTQDDINNNKITYHHDGDSYVADAFTFNVKDTGGETTPLTDFAITINNNPPTSADNTVTTNEDTPKTFDTDDFTFIDPDTGDTFAGVQITTFPGKGTLTCDGTAVTNDNIPYTCADVTKLVYTPMENENGTAYTTFKFKVQDNNGKPSVNDYTMTVDVTPVNDPPVNTVPAAQTIDEDTPLTFSTANSNKISISDVDAGTADVKVTLTATNGTLTLNETTGLTFETGDGADDATMTFTGKMSDINAALDGMTFKPTANYNGTGAKVEITTNDQGNSPNTPKEDIDSVAITVEPLNDPPTSADKTVTTNEDTPKTFDTDDFTFIDPDTGDTFAGVQITTFPGKGTLTCDGTAVTNDNIPYTCADVTKLVYKPMENENGDTYTTFKFKVQDNNGTPSVSDYTMTVDVTPVNDPPEADAQTVSTPKNIDKTITLSGSDADTGDTLTYKITDLPEDGTLYQVNADGTKGAEITAASPDVTNSDHKVIFEPATDETGEPYTNFQFTVNDGTVDSDPATVTVNVTETNTPPTIATADTEVNKGESVPIKKDNLTATDNEDDDPTLTYTLTTAPEKGKLYITPAGGTKTELTPDGTNTFTQDDVDEGRITYEHTDTTTPAPNDSFKVKVTDSDGAESAEATVTIKVTQSLDLSEDKVKTPGLIEEKTKIPGQTYRLTEEPTKGTFYRIEEDNTKVPENTDLSEGEVTEPELIEEKVPGQTYKLVEEPTKGTVYLLEEGSTEPVELTEGDTFTQEDIDEGNLLYEHLDENNSATDIDEGDVAQENLDEDSSATEDKFMYTVTDPQGGESEEIPFVITFNPILGLEMDLVCDTIAVAGGLMNCTVVYTNTGTITTTALWVGVTQPMNTIYDPDTSDPRWKVAIGDRAMSSIDQLNSDMITYDYAALVDSLSPNQSGVIKVAFRVSEDLPLGEPVGLNAGFQDREGEEVVVEAQDSASVSIAKTAIYMPMVIKASTK